MSQRSPQFALCSDLAIVDGKAPERVELIPAGPRVRGRDGREWTFDKTAQELVIAAFRERNVALPIDWEHATQHRAPAGLDAPAAAWIEDVDVQSGALWGRVNWTERGANQVVNKAYRYLSPVFDFDPKSGRIVRIVCAGLTNLPNLHLQALNNEEVPTMRSTALVAAIVGALGLTESADDDAIAAAIEKLKKDRDATAQAANTERPPSLDRYVPRPDYDAIVARATNAERTLAERDSADHKSSVDVAIKSALSDGKITPATEAYHRASCSDAAGLQRFQEFVKAAPVIAGASGLDTRKPVVTETALNAQTLADRARTYQAEQAKAGNVISTAAAVRHVQKDVVA